MYKNSQFGYVMIRKEKICYNCKVLHSYSTKLCQNCNVCKRKYGTFKPNHWIKKCDICSYSFENKYGNAKYCQECRQKYNLANTKYIKRKKTNPSYKRKENGLGTITKSGYKVITKVGHPNAGYNGKIQEHTYIMSEHLKRALHKHESVHHTNGIRNDNRIENLELWSKSQPAGQRVKDKIKWCKEFLELYGFKIASEN